MINDQHFVSVCFSYVLILQDMGKVFCFQLKTFHSLTRQRDFHTNNCRKMFLQPNPYTQYLHPERYHHIYSSWKPGQGVAVGTARIFGRNGRQYNFRLDSFFPLGLHDLCARIFGLRDDTLNSFKAKHPAKPDTVYFLYELFCWFCTINHCTCF